MISGCCPCRVARLRRECRVDDVAEGLEEEEGEGGGEDDGRQASGAVTVVVGCHALCVKWEGEV